MRDDLEHFELWAAEQLARVSPAQRRKLALSIARELRRRQAERIAQQTNPDGTPYAPRKRGQSKRAGARASQRRIKRQAMFMKLRTARWLTVSATVDGAEVGFRGRVAQIAAVHQHGERAPVAPNGPAYRYPRRVLLGLTDTDRQSIRDALIDFLSPR
ncbi:phage virion morphogenesis protein [Burkholderia gladioli]|uniref:phage virion morphogenesis protein n=1 Tax=Burkholderia gladioli TaxID=28095 RepID=UPI0016402F53|nr:phage virion morphogenesis protein [Burkholderia gladioli]